MPGASVVSNLFARGWRNLLPWFAVHVLQLTGPEVTAYKPSGSGDKALDYVMCVLLLLVALAATLFWSVADSKRPNYITLDSWLRVGVRYFLILWLLSFGINKVIPIQFTFPSLSELLRPIGMRSPAGMLWTFMGASPGYVIFSGTAEVIAGVLLIFRRTTTLGSIVAAGVLTNVVALNYGYDLGVKLFSSHLLLMSIFLIAPHLQALAAIFVFEKAVQITESNPLESWSPIFRNGAMCVKVLLLGFFVVSTANRDWSNYEKYRSFSLLTPLYGIYEVERFTRSGREVPPLATDGSRWKKLILQTPTGVGVQLMTDTTAFYRAKYTSEKHTLELLDATAKSSIGQFSYFQPDEQHLVLTGILGNEPLQIHLSRVDLSGFRLMKSRFSWTHETPPSNQ